MQAVETFAPDFIKVFVACQRGLFSTHSTSKRRLNKNRRPTLRNGTASDKTSSRKRFDDMRKNRAASSVVIMRGGFLSRRSKRSNRGTRNAGESIRETDSPVGSVRSFGFFKNASFLVVYSLPLRENPVSCQFRIAFARLIPAPFPSNRLRSSAFVPLVIGRNDFRKAKRR